MKLLHINCNYYGSTLHENLAEALKDHSIDSCFFVPLLKNNVEHEHNDHVYPANCFGKYDRIVFFFKQMKIYKALCSQNIVENIDLVYANTLFSDGNIAYKLMKERGIPYVVAIRNTDINAYLKYKPWLLSRGLRILRNARSVVFISKSYKDNFFSKYITEKDKTILETKTYIIPNAIDNFWIENRNMEPKSINDKSDPLKLIFAGRIDKNKNIATIQKAMDILSKQGINCELKVIGPVSEADTYNSIIQDKHTDYKESMPKEKLLLEYRNADIFVMPSFAETFGLVYVEAMSQGLPVVYTRGQGFDGVFREGEVGYSANSNSPESVADAIVKCRNNYRERSSKCIECSARFNWDNISTMYYSMFQNASIDTGA